MFIAVRTLIKKDIMIATTMTKMDESDFYLTYILQSIVISNFTAITPIVMRWTFCYAFVF